MTPIAYMVAQMIAAGMPGDVIVLAVQAVEKATSNVDVTSSKRRRGVVTSTTSDDKRRERDRRYRLKKQANARKTDGATEANDAAAPSPADVGNVDANDDVSDVLRSDLSFFLSSSSEEETTEGRKKASEERKKRSDTRARGTRITDDFQPTSDVAAYVANLGVADFRDEFVDYWIAVPGSRGLKLDWQRTYKNRARDIADKRGHRQATSGGGWAAVHKELRERMDAQYEQGSDDDGDEAGGTGPGEPRLR